MTTYRTINIDGLDIFYREAGSPHNPTILLLHGFPTSSHMFRNLMSAQERSLPPDRTGLSRLWQQFNAHG